LFACVVVAVTMQLKFCGYHWVLLVAPFGLAFAVTAREISALTGPRRGCLIAASALVASFLLTGSSATRYASEQINVAKYVTGAKSPGDYAGFFDADNLLFSYRISKQMGDWARAHTEPSDTIVVRGFEPVVYVVADRRAPTRFFWTSALFKQGWAYKATAWEEEDHAALLRNPPKVVFALGITHDWIESAEYFERMGYVERTRFGNHIALERGAPREDGSP
jgi:hypothetical protein